MSLNDWTASGVGVSMSISFTPTFDIPVNYSFYDHIYQEALRKVFPLQCLQMNGVFILVLQSGVFVSGKNIRLILLGTMTNLALPQNANNAVAATVTDGLGIILGESATGYTHPIVDGTFNVAISLDWRGNGTSSVGIHCFVWPHFILIIHHHNAYGQCSSEFVCQYRIVLIPKHGLSLSHCQFGRWCSDGVNIIRNVQQWSVNQIFVTRNCHKCCHCPAPTEQHFGIYCRRQQFYTIGESKCFLSCHSPFHNCVFALID